MSTKAGGQETGENGGKRFRSGRQMSREGIALRRVGNDCRDIVRRKPCLREAVIDAVDNEIKITGFYG